MLNFMFFILFLALLSIAILIYRSKKEDLRSNQEVNLVSSNLITLQRVQLELGLHEIPQWNGYRNELQLYRLRLKRSDAEYALSRYRLGDLTIEY